MKKRTFLKSMGAGLAAGAASPAFSGSRLIDIAPVAAGACELKQGSIQHMVIFSLKHARDSQAASTFLKDGKRILSAIPGVTSFQVFSQVSKKNDYDFGFSMVFSGRADYEKYNNHADHVNFVDKRWKTEVSRFLEIDFESR
jgi:Stress responsive A/B Barrel Domain